MAKETILKEFKTMFETEKYNKFQISEYNLSKFKKIDELIQKANQLNETEKLKEIAEEAIHENEFNFSALFVLGQLNYQSNKIVDATKQFQKLITFFKKKNKLSILEYLSRKMLEFGDDIFALQNLIFALQTNANNPDLIPLQERLIVLDPSNTTIILQLAAHKKKEHEPKQAIKYFLMALNNFIEKADKKQVESTWRQIIELSENPLATLLPLEKSLLANFEHEFVFNMLNILGNNLKKENNLHETIQLYKKLLKFHPENKELRSELIEMYSKLYDGHSQLEEYVLLSGLKQWWNDVFESIEKFEKYIQFDINRYVYHEGWGVGKITDIKNQEVTIDFEKETDHKMTFDMALSSLQVLPDEHIKVYKRYKKDELQQYIKKDPVKIIEIFSQKIDKKLVSVDTIKSEVIGDLLETKEWSRWWTKAKSILKINPHFEFIDNKTIRYISNPISYEEQLISNFKDAQSFEQKLTLISELINYDKKGMLDISLYQEIVNYLNSMMNSSDSQTAMKSFLIILQIKKHKQDVKVETKNFEFKKHFPKKEKLIDLFNDLKETENKKLFVKLIEEHFTNAYDYLEQLLYANYSSIHSYLIEKVLAYKGKDVIQKYCDTIIEQYKDYPDIFFWIGKNIITKSKDFQDFNIDETTIYINMMFLFSFIGRKLRVATDENEEEYKKIQKNIISLFFDKKEPLLLKFVVAEKKKNNPKIDTLMSLVLDNKYLSDKYKKMLLDEVRNLENMIIT